MPPASQSPTGARTRKIQGEGEEGLKKLKGSCEVLWSLHVDMIWVISQRGIKVKIVPKEKRAWWHKRCTGWLKAIRGMDEVSDMILTQYLSMGGFLAAICHHLASVPSMTSLLFLFDKNMTLLCFGPKQAQIRWKRLNISMNLLIHHHHLKYWYWYTCDGQNLSKRSQGTN